MVTDRNFCVASANVHSQKFDDEVVIIDTKSGIYFSLRGSAVDVWSLVEAHASGPTIAASLTARYDGDRDQIIAAAERCLAQLSAHGLIRETGSNGAATVAVPMQNGPKQPFAEPQIEHFNDMQDLLLLDPIHDVSEEGWPHPAPTAAP